MTEPFQENPTVTRDRKRNLCTPSTIGGVALCLIAIVALWAMSDLSAGTLRAIGPAAMPRAIAMGMGVLGVLLCISGIQGRDDGIEALPVRGTVVILVAIILFAITIRPVALGPLTTPGLGLIGAGPIAILVAGLAQRERNWLDLSILAAALTAFCMLLFGYLLNLPIPAFPVSLLGFFPGWQQSDVLLGLSLALLALALGLFFVRKRSVSAPVGDAK